MNSNTKRKITATVVSLMLVAVIAVTGVLCAVNFNKDKGGEQVPTTSVAYSDYGMTKADALDSSNSAYVYAKFYKKKQWAWDPDDNGYIVLQYPKEIYMDLSESLWDAGYYYHIRTDYTTCSKEYGSRATLLANTVFGFYNGNTAYNPSGNATTMTDYFKENGVSVENTQNCSVELNQNDDNSANKASRIIINAANAYVDFRLTGKAARTTGDSGVTFEMPKSKRVTWLQYKGWADTGNTNSTFDGSVADASHTDHLSGVEFRDNINISVYIYEKSDLYQAVVDLQNSMNELDGLITEESRQAAKDLIADAKTILATRKTTQAEIDKCKNDLNSFVFDIERPHTSVNGWIFGDSNHADGAETKLGDGIWSKYNENLAKYFNVSIVNTIKNEFNSSIVEDTQTRYVTNAETYRKDGYVKDAGDYTITFTARRNAANSSEINHGVQWSTDSENADAVITLTIGRANMRISPATEPDRTYTGSAQSYAMSTSGSVVTLQGNMQPNADAQIVVKLTKTNLGGVTGALGWENCSNSISFTEVGTHKVYYRIQARNHNAVAGEYTVVIKPAAVTVTMGNAAINKNSSGGVLTYGDAVLSSEEIISQGVTGVKIGNDSNNGVVNKNSLSNILVMGLYDGGAFVDNNLTNAGNHEVRVRDYKAVTQSAEEKAENPLITNWNQRINVTISNGTAAYSIAKKEIELVWSDTSNQIYDGLGNHRPTATVKAGDEVEGGEVFTFNTYILTGAAAGRPEGTAGVIVVDGVSYDVPLTDGGNAVWAGTYKVGVSYREGSNYTVSADSATTEFEIKQRKLHVNVLDREGDYAQALNDERDVNAGSILNIYQNAMFNDNSGNNKVYEFGDDTSLAVAGSASRVFELDIVGVPTTNSNLGSADSFYCAGVHKNTLVARLRSADETDMRGDAIDINRIHSYDFSYTAGTLTINEAEIRSTRQYMRKTFNGTEQEYALKMNPIVLSGYESIHRDESGIVTIKYSTSLANFASTATTDPIKLRDHANGEGVIIYYQIEAANHKTTEILNFTAYMDRLFLDITVGKQTTTYYYGDNIPDSTQLISALNLTWDTRNSDAAEDAGQESNFVLEENLAFYIANAGQKVTDRKIGANTYTLNLEPLSAQNSLNNYNISFIGNGSSDANTNAFTISPRPLIVDWRQSGGNWIDDGLHFVYNATAPRIQPTVRAYRNADLSLYNDKSTGANTSDDQNDGWVENFVEGDSISLRDQLLQGSTYTAEGYLSEKTSLSKTENIKNYVLVNPTATYYIVKREVKINVFDQNATYGSAKSVALGRLISSSSAGAKWEYNDATPYQFIRDHYMNWQLSSEAIEGNASDYKNVGIYSIALEEAAGNDGAVAGNYDIIVYRKHADGTVDADPATSYSDVAKFEITVAKLNIGRREFNFDASPIDPEDSNSALKETCDMDIKDIRNIIRVVGGTKGSDLTITMSATFSGNAEDSTFPDGTEMTDDRHIQFNSTEHIGRYHVWVLVTNGNYEDLCIPIDINYLTNWISILLGEQITANYGDTVMSSEDLFKNLNVESITGVMDESGNSQITDAQEAWKAIQTRDYFSLYVGRGDKTALKTNESVGNYSVYMNIKKENVGAGEDELHFRFVGATIGEGVTSNVDIYKVIERPIYLVWQDNINERYGFHSDQSPSHTGYTVMNILKDETGKDKDDVKISIKYDVDNTSQNPGEISGNHVHYVGDYIATLEGVSHHNYRIAEIGDVIDGVKITSEHLTKKFSINKRRLTVVIKNQSLTYGSLDTRVNTDDVNNIKNYLNSSAAYTIGGDGLYDEDLARDVFELLAIYEELPKGCNYLPVSSGHRIRGNQLSGKIANQYRIEFVRENGADGEEDANLTITPANFTIDSMQFNTIFFDGKWHSPLDYNNGDALQYTFAGDADYAFAHRVVWFNENVNAQASDSGWVMATDRNGLKFRNAGTHKFAVMVETENHNPRIRNDITFTILAVNVKINMPSVAVKTYGDVIGNGTEKAISDFIKANTGLTYEVTTSRDPWEIENVGDAFIFYVVVGGEQGADGGEGIEVGNFANGVGSYRVYHKFADGETGNYNVSYEEKDGMGCNAKAFKIVPREVEVIWYNGDLDNMQPAKSEYTYTGKVVDLHAAFEAIRYDEDSNQLVRYYEELTVDGLKQDAKNEAYTASANFGFMRAVSQNYTLKESTTSFSYKINPRDIVVVLKNQGNIYGNKIIFNSGIENWSVEDDEWTTIPNANMVLTLKTPDGSLSGGEYEVVLSSGTYDIEAVCGNTNFNVTFKDEEGEEGWGKYTVTNAEISNVANSMGGFVYNGADQDVDMHEYIGNNNVTIHGNMTWAQAKVYFKSGDNWVETLPTVKNVGTTAIDFKICLANHEDYVGTMDVTVDKATIIYNADIFEIQYGEPVLESDELFEKLNVRINTELGDSLAVNLKKLVELSVEIDTMSVGQYRLQVEILGDLADNLDVQNQFKDENEDPTALPYHIVPRVITVNWGDTERVYNAQDQYFESVGFNNVMSGDTIANPSYSLVGGSEQAAKGKNVGEYNVAIVVNKNNKNYVVDEASRNKTFTIKPKEVEIEWNESEAFVYDGEGHMLTANIVGGVYPGDTCSITAYSPDMISAGEHVAKVEELSNLNYTVPERANKTFTIQAREVIIIWEIENFVYNGSEQCLKAHVSASSLIGGDTCEVVVSGGGINAGTHRAIVSELKNTNYKLPYGGAGQEFAIAPRTIKSIIWSNTTLTYEENNGLGVAQVPTAAVGDGMVEGDKVEFEIFVSQGEAINVGSYTANIVGVKGGNYIIDASVNNRSTDFTIQKAQNSLDNNLTLPNKDGGLPALADFESVSSKYGNAIVKYYRDGVEYTGNLNDAPKGTYDVVVMVEGTQNYDPVSRSFQVEVEGSSNAGLIAGITVPIAVLAIAAVVLAIILVKKKKGKKDEAQA